VILTCSGFFRPIYRRGGIDPLGQGDRHAQPVISTRGAPAFLRSDNGPEFVATALLKWATENKIEKALIDPGKPWQNVYRPSTFCSAQAAKANASAGVRMFSA
jgi:transposase InsO family protein